MVPVEGGTTGPLRRCSSDECVGEAGWERVVSSGECRERKRGGGRVRETSCLSTYTSVQTLCLPRPDASKSRKSIHALVELNESSRRTRISGASTDAIWCFCPVCLGVKLPPMFSRRDVALVTKFRPPPPCWWRGGKSRIFLWVFFSLTWYTVLIKLEGIIII